MPETEWKDRKKLFHIIDADHEDLYVVAETFKEAEEKFLKWNNDPSDAHRDAIEAILPVGYLIDESTVRE